MRPVLAHRWRYLQEHVAEHTRDPPLVARGSRYVVTPWGCRLACRLLAHVGQPRELGEASGLCRVWPNVVSDIGVLSLLGVCRLWWMITHIGTAMLYVSDKEASLVFYRDLLGFTVLTDQDMGNGARWLELATPDGLTTIALHDAAQDGKQPGEGAYLTFACDDVHTTVKELRSRGGEVSDPDEQPWGTFAFVEGPDKHRVQIHQK